MNSKINIACGSAIIIAACAYVVWYVGKLTGTSAAQPEVSQFISDGGGSTLEPSKRTVPESGITVTGTHDIPSVATFHRPTNVTIARDQYDSITIPGNHVITHAEAEEVVRALDLARAYADMSATVITTVIKHTDDPTNADQAFLAKAVAGAKESSQTFTQIGAKWKKRVEEAKK